MVAAWVTTKLDDTGTSAGPIRWHRHRLSAYGHGVRYAFDHVVFDLDGTLVDSLPDIAAAVNHVRHHFELAPMAQTAIGACVGDGARALIERALGEEHRARWPESLRMFLERYSAHLLDRTRPYPGIQETLARLAERGITLSVLSNKPVAMCRGVLEGLALATLFAHVLGGDSLSARKPDPAGLLHLARSTGIAVDRVLMVGDSSIDWRTAQHAGTGFCGVSWGYASEDLSAEVSPLISKPVEILSVVFGTDNPSL